MDEKTNNVDMDKSESIKDPTAFRPSPADFDIFVPWACKEYRVVADVIVTRCVQEVYVSTTTTNKKHVLKRKPSKQPSLVTTQDPAIHEEYHSSEIGRIGRGAAQKIVNIETIYDSHENLVELKFLKNREIPRKVIQVLALTIPSQQHLTSITINSGLCMDSLYELSKCLPNSQITELCLDGTCLSQANYYTLLTQSKLKHLSLARCTLNDTVVKTIADQLKETCPAARTLSALNLSTNRITDVSAKYLADVLRTNRHLSYLNLAGNMITDEGGVSILNTLQKFPLQSEELLESRVRYVAHLKKRNDLINTFISELQTTGITKNYKKKSTKRTKLESQSMQQHCELTAEAQIILERAEYLADSKLGSFNEPFSPNNTETRDGVVHCFGNNTLCYLNLAYNNLTYVSIKKLLEVLTVQKKLNRTPRGLVKVVFVGNSMPATCAEFDEIENILESIIDGFRKPSESASRKKPVSARPVVR